MGDITSSLEAENDFTVDTVAGKVDAEQYELNGLVSREIEGHKVILPVWHKVTKKEVEHFSAPLSDKVAATTVNASIRKIARALAEAMTHEEEA